MLSVIREAVRAAGGVILGIPVVGVGLGVAEGAGVAEGGVEGGREGVGLGALAAQADSLGRSVRVAAITHMTKDHLPELSL